MLCPLRKTAAFLMPKLVGEKYWHAPQAEIGPRRVPIFLGKKTPMPRLNTIFPPVPEAPLKRPGLRNDEYMIYYINYLINYVLYISPLRKLFKGPCLRSMPGGIIRGNI